MCMQLGDVTQSQPIGSLVIEESTPVRAEFAAQPARPASDSQQARPALVLPSAQ